MYDLVSPQIDQSDQGFGDTRFIQHESIEMVQLTCAKVFVHVLPRSNEQPQVDAISCESTR